MNVKAINILLVEDNPGDIELTKEAFAQGEITSTIEVVTDGEQAMAFLHKEGGYASATTPDIILLDLNLPKKDGREVLSEIKSDDQLKKIPTIILTTSQADEDVNNAYENHANCYIRKPVDMEQFIHVAHRIEEFWLSIVKLPNR